jgi:S-adenosylmethionine hydrolase
MAGEHDFQAWELTNERLLPENVSCTFHGRDVMAPACAHLALGKFKPSDFGPRLSEIVKLEAAEAKITGSSVTGRILTVDRFGNAITNISAEELGKIGRQQEFRVLFGEHVIGSISRTYSSVAWGQMVAYIGSAGLLELAVNGGNLADLHDAEPGDEVKVRKRER